MEFKLSNVLYSMKYKDLVLLKCSPLGRVEKTKEEVTSVKAKALGQ